MHDYWNPGNIIGKGIILVYYIYMERNNTKQLRYHCLYKAKTEDVKERIPLYSKMITLEKKYKTKANSKIGNYRQFSWKEIKNPPEYIKNRLEQVFKTETNRNRNQDSSPDNYDRKIRKLKNLSFKANLRLNRNKKQLEMFSKKSIAEQQQTLNSERANTCTIKQMSPRKNNINSKIHLRLASITCSKPEIYCRNLQVEQDIKRPIILKYQGERVVQVVCRYEKDQQEGGVTKKRRHTVGLPKSNKIEQNGLQPWGNSEINDDIICHINQ